MSRVRWGVLSTARIAIDKVIPGMQGCSHAVVAAIASRDRDRAVAAAERLGIPTAYGTYDELLADPDVDAIYNPLPNHLHVPWSIRALDAGKHVLCEKPIGLSAAEGRELVAAGARHPRLKLMEAFMYRFHPQWQRTRQIVRDGGIGTLRTIQTAFAYRNLDPHNIRNRADVGGGGLMDIGCYPISLSRFLFESEPQRVCGIVEFDPNFGTDRLASAILEFGPAGTSAFTCSTQLDRYQRVNVFGTEGRIEIEIPFNAPPDRPCRLWHQRGERIDEIACDVCDQYGLQFDAFSRAILEDAPVPTPIADAVANMETIEAVFASARTGTWIAPGTAFA